MQPLAAADRVRRRSTPRPPVPCLGADDYALRRFLRARKHNILKAKLMLLVGGPWAQAVVERQRGLRQGDSERRHGAQPQHRSPAGLRSRTSPYGCPLPQDTLKWRKETEVDTGGWQAAGWGCPPPAGGCPRADGAASTSRSPGRSTRIR